jgi:competence protein ComEA
LKLNKGVEMKILTMIFLGVSLLFGAVDINTADAKELSSLKGVGAKKAGTIIEYRSANCFKNVDELVKVKGIGKKTVEKNRDNLTASECKK